MFSRGGSVVACSCSNALLQCRAHFVGMRHACHVLLRQLPSTLPHAYNQYVTKGSTNLHAFCYRFEQKRREGAVRLCLQQVSWKMTSFTGLVVHRLLAK